MQRQVLERISREAAEAAEEGRKEVLGLLGSAAFRRHLRQLDRGDQLHLLDAERLLQRLHEELAVAELVHNFGDPDTPGSEGNCGMDVTLEDGKGPGAPYFYNQWMLQALGLVPVDPANNVFVDKVEVNIFGFPAFTNSSRPDLKTSADRPYYAALNMYRASGGNPQCGPVSAILSRPYVAGDAMAAPTDTGLFVDFCGVEQRGTAQWDGQWLLRCEVWPPSVRKLGVPGQLDHLLPTYLAFFNATQAVAGDEYVEYNLARLVVRLLSRRTYAMDHNESRGDPAPGRAALPLNFFENTFGYMEVNPLVTITYPEGIAMMVGLFDVLFGTPTGERLRQWCVERSWPLAWAHSPVDSTWRCGPEVQGCPFPSPDLAEGVEPASARILDPWVLQRVREGWNCTSGADFVAAEAAFQAAWSEATAHVAPAPANSTARRTAMDTRWSPVLASAGALLVEPLFHGACADLGCVGVAVQTGHCVCRERDPVTLVA